MIKKVLILATSLVTVTLSSAVYSQSSTPTMNEPGCIREPQAYIAPENLANMAYQGYLEKQGIPGYDEFKEEFASGKITAEKVVQAAVTGCLLSDNYGVASHSNYLKDVQEQMRLLVEEGR